MDTPPSLYDNEARAHWVQYVHTKVQILYTHPYKHTQPGLYCNDIRFYNCLDRENVVLYHIKINIVIIKLLSQVQSLSKPLRR